MGFAQIVVGQVSVLLNVFFFSAVVSVLSRQLRRFLAKQYNP